MKGRRIGIIAEDESDVAVLKLLASKLTSRPFSVSQAVGKGCGSIKRKTPGWCESFVAKGCSSIVLVHDRDRHVEKKLRQELEKLLVDSGRGDIAWVVIPCEELEAWLLSDTRALQVAMNLATAPKGVSHPELVSSPKEEIGKLVRQHSKTKSMRYVNTVHNLQIANALSTSAISKKCPSFRVFEAFVASAI